MTPELEQLGATLDGLRAGVVKKLAGLSEEDARRSTVDSGTNLAGLVQHLTFVESMWFEEVVAGTTAARGDRSMQVDPSVSLRTLRAEYHAACAASNAIIAAPGGAFRRFSWIRPCQARRMIDDFAKEYLHDALRWARASLLRKMDGLSEYDVRRPLSRTGTNLLGLVKHLTLSEARYFGAIFDRPYPEPIPSFDDPGFIANAVMTTGDAVEAMGRASGNDTVRTHRDIETRG